MKKRADGRGKPKGDRPWWVVAAHIMRMMKVRYPPAGTIGDDRAGRDRLRAFIDHKLLAGSKIAELRGIVARLAPWMDQPEQEHLVEKCFEVRQGWTPFELGQVFHLTLDERNRFSVWQMWPDGFTEEDAAQHRLRSKAESAARSRQKCAVKQHAKSRAVHDDPDLGEHGKAIYGLTTSAWMASSLIKDEISKWPAYRRQNSTSLRQIISRSLRKLEAGGLIERTVVEASRKQKIVLVRRTETALPTGCPRPDVTVTTVTRPKPTSAVH